MLLSGWKAKELKEALLHKDTMHREVQPHPMPGACMHDNATLAWLTFGISYKPRLHNMSCTTRHTETPPSPKP